MAVKWSEHPSVVQDDGRLRLKVFSNFKPDPTLPKHLVNGKVVLRNGRTMTVEQFLSGADGMSFYRSNELSADNARKRDSLMDRITGWWRRLLSKTDAPPDTFGLAKGMIESNVIAGDIGDMAERLKGIVDRTLANGQVALAKRLEGEHRNILNEVVLVKNGLFHYLTEEDAIRLLKTSDRGIRIDFWNDYPEFVPDDVLLAKKKADALCVFDNWCVMHYDPKGSALRQMKAEEWRRDPILFGMVVGSDRLYFVRDWTTEKDDLTIGKVCEMLNISVLRDAKDYGANSPYNDLDGVLMTEPNEYGLTSTDIALPSSN